VVDLLFEGAGGVVLMGGFDADQLGIWIRGFAARGMSAQ